MAVVDYEIRERKLYHRAFTLAVLTIIFSLLEGGFSVWYGFVNKSLTLFGNGVISFIEVISGFGIVMMTKQIFNSSKANYESSERRALRIIGFGLYALTVGLIGMSIITMILHQHPQTGVAGIIIGIITILVIGSLVIMKMNVGRKLDSHALLADAKCTRLCVYMSTTVLIASAIYELTQFEYSDSFGALALAFFAFVEAKECFRFN